MNKRRIIVCAGVLLVLAALCALLAVVGRGHSVYLDNKEIAYEGQTYACPYKLTISAKGKQVAKIYEDERGETACMGQTLRLEVRVMQTKGGAEETHTFTVRIPYGEDGMIVNVNGLLAGLPPEACMEPFTPAGQQPAEDSTVPGTEEVLPANGF